MINEEIRLLALIKRTLEEITSSTISSLRERPSFSVIRTISYLSHHQGCCMGDLAQGLSITYPSATNMVDVLVKKGWAVRIKNSSDGRSVEIHLTRTGRNVVQDLEKERLKRLNNLLSRMEREEREFFVRGIRSFIRAARMDEETDDLISFFREKSL
jgi:DNA-binding MarR family transcriptional regulator